MALAAAVPIATESTTTLIATGVSVSTAKVHGQGYRDAALRAGRAAKRLSASVTQIAHPRGWRWIQPGGSCSKRRSWTG